MKKGLFFLLGILLLLGISSKNNKKLESPKEEVRGIYISYIEISNNLKDKKEEESKKKIKEMIENVNNLSLNTIILQVRPSCDAIYPSSIFPISKYLTEEETYPYDVLEYFIEESHKKKIKLYAWINPYRVSTTNEKIKENLFLSKYRYLIRKRRNLSKSRKRRDNRSNPRRSKRSLKLQSRWYLI